MKTVDVLIIGAGHAGVECAMALRAGGFAGTIALLSDENALPYERPPLSKGFLAGTTDSERLHLRAEKVFADQGIELVLGTRVARLDAQQRHAVTESGAPIAFGHCVIATGAGARALPPLQGEAVFSIRTLADTQALRGRLAPGSRLLVAGGAYLGLEAACRAAKVGADVSVLEQGPSIMPGRVSDHTARNLTDLHREHGVRIHTGCRIGHWERDGVVWRAHGADGDMHEAELVLVAIGAQPNIALAEEAGVACDGGILVDQECRTSAPGIFAIGDCAAARRPETGLAMRVESVNNALVQARIVAAVLAGKPVAPYRPPTFWSEQCGKRLQMAGLAAPGKPIEDQVKTTARGWLVERYQEGILRAVEAVDSPAEFMQGLKRIGSPQPPTTVQQ
ncbi:MAG: NAD(P)/FAD-dependent oxidoreductase [Noviherbaspirillum sp.]